MKKDASIFRSDQTAKLINKYLVKNEQGRSPGLGKH
jgi:hypothetical protein